MSDLKALAAVAALNEMFCKGYLSICTIDTIGKMLGRNPKGEAYDILHSLHCVHFDRMPKDLRDSIPGLIRQCLDVEPIYQFEPAAAPPAPAPPPPPPARLVHEHAPRLLGRLFQ